MQASRTSPLVAGGPLNTTPQNHAVPGDDYTKSKLLSPHVPVAVLGAPSVRLLSSGTQNQQKQATGAVRENERMRCTQTAHKHQTAATAAAAAAAATAG